MGFDVRDALRFHSGRVRRKWSATLHGQSMDAFDMRAFPVLEPLAGGYAPWSSYAMRPSGVVAVLNEIVTGRRESIVETGSGVSTLYAARLLAQLRRGRLISIEHDAEWAALVRGWLEAEGLDGCAAVVHAPLVAGRWGTGDWYDTAVLERELAGTPIDLLVVDGPPAFSKVDRLARYPAPIHFRDALVPSAAILLDDIGRRAEQEVVRRWEAELGRTFVRRFLDGGIALSRAR